MDISFSLPAFWVGLAGAAGHEALRWIALRHTDNLPVYFRSVHYWVLTSLLVVIGGLVAALLGPANVAQAIGIGISAPAILTRLGTLAGERDVQSGPNSVSGIDSHFESKTSFREFMRG